MMCFGVSIDMGVIHGPPYKLNCCFFSMSVFQFKYSNLYLNWFFFFVLLLRLETLIWAKLCRCCHIKLYDVFRFCCCVVITPDGRIFEKVFCFVFFYFSNIYKIVMLMFITYLRWIMIISNLSQQLWEVFVWQLCCDPFGL